MIRLHVLQGCVGSVEQRRAVVAVMVRNADVRGGMHRRIDIGGFLRERRCLPKQAGDHCENCESLAHGQILTSGTDAKRGRKAGEVFFRPMICLPRLLYAFGLALALVLGQHATALHVLAHASDEVQQKDSTSPGKTCEQHSLFVALGHGVAAKSAIAPLVAAECARPAVEALRSAALPQRFRFHSRAPPPTPA